MNAFEQPNLAKFRWIKNRFSTFPSKHSGQQSISQFCQQLGSLPGQRCRRSLLGSLQWCLPTSTTRYLLFFACLLGLCCFVNLYFFFQNFGCTSSRDRTKILGIKGRCF